MYVHIYVYIYTKPQILAGAAYDGSDGLGGNARALRRGALGRPPPSRVFIYIDVFICI